MTLDEAIKLVVTLHTASDKLQRDIIAKDMDLKTVIESARALELTQREVSFMKQNTLEPADPEVHSMSKRQRESRHDDTPTGRQETKDHETSRNKGTVEVCKYCGHQTPHKGRCKARGATCYKCKKKGHFSVVCQSKPYKQYNKPVEQLQQSASSEDEDPQASYKFDHLSWKLDQVSTGKVVSPPSSEYNTLVTIRIQDQRLKVQVDSGAEVNVMDYATYQAIHKRPPLRNTSAKLKPYGSKPLPVKGCFKTTVRANGQEVKTTFYVTQQSASTPIIGKYTAFDLDILKINVNELLPQPEVYNNRTPKQTSSPKGTHLEYSEMAKQLTPLSNATNLVTQLHEQHGTPESVVQHIVKKHDKVFHGIGKHKYRQVELIIDKTVQPKVQAQRRIPFPKRKQFDEIIQELEDADIIEPVEGQTEWISNVVLTPKSNPTQLRMNIDMTTANTAIKRTRHVIPTLEELRYKLNGAKHFTKLDMKQGYMQLELKHESRYMTTFYTHRGLRRFKRLNFGTNSAAEIFHQEISQAVVDIDHADNLYDDIIVYGKTQLEHDIALAQVLQRFEDCGLTLGLPKCKFNQSEIEFFGMKFSAAGMTPTEDKVKALIEAPAPTSVSEVRSFLGMANYSANFIQHHSETTAPLRRLTTKNARFQWTNECQKAFETLKEAMASPPVMTYYDPKRPTLLIVDGSKYGFASMLMQEDPETGEHRVVRYNSRSTTQPESRYAQIEIESAAVEFAIKRNHLYLYGLPKFIVITDHKPLLPLYNTYRAEMPPRIHRHKLNLQGYNFILKHEPGKDNPTDYMSRHPAPIPGPLEQREHQDADLVNHHVNAIIRDDLPAAVTLEQMKRGTEKDATMQRLIHAIRRGYINSIDRRKLMPYRYVFDELSTADGLVLRGSKLVVPESLRDKVVTLAHEGHQGIVRTKQFLRATTWFLDMDKRIETEVAHCMACQVTVRTPQQEPLKPTTLPAEPWDTLATDLHGPLPTGEYLLVVQCLYSRYPAVEIVRSTSADACIPVMDKILSQFGIPTVITSDNGPPYNSEKFKLYAKYMGFEHKKKIPYTPWANGTAENFMKNLGKVIETAQEEKLNWRQELHKFLRAYRATPHPMTKKSPASLLFNSRKYKTRLPTPTNKTILVYDKEVRQNDMDSKKRMKQRADSKKHVKESAIKVGDKVLCQQKQLRKHTSAYSSEIMRVIKRKGSLVVARGETKTITRHITFFKKVTDDFNTETSTPTPDKVTATNSPPEVDVIPPTVEGQSTRESVPTGQERPTAEPVLEERERAREVNREPVREGRPVRNRRPPVRFRDEIFENHVNEET